MNIDNFKTFLSRNSVAEESWKIYYNFSNITGGLVVLNELYPPETQFSGACIYVSNNPGLIVGINTGGFVYDGSGYFSGDSIVRLNRSLDDPDWTIFMSYKNSGCQIQRDKSTILFSNQTNLSDSSGLCFGFNGANKFFIEYNNLTGKNTYTSQYEGKNSTLFSLSKNLNRFELSVHDPINSDNTLESFKLDNYQNSNIYYLGNSYNTFRDYTGFNGYMDDFLYFSGSIGATQRNNLAKGIFSTEIIPAYTVKIVSGYNKISSSSITTGIIIGSGITGYQEISVGTIPRKNGSSIQICEQSGIIGPLYGEQILFTTGSATGSRIINITIPEEIRYDFPKLRDYTSNRIKLLYTIDSLDSVEINTYTGFFDNYRDVTQYDNNLQQFVLGLQSTGQSINLFSNGVFEQSGLNVNGNIVSGDYNLSGNRYVNSNGFFDQFTDKIIYFDTITTPQVFDYIGFSRSYVFNNNLNDVMYLNGQKLISGYDYTFLGPQVFFNARHINSTGRVLATSRTSNIYKRFTGYYVTLTGNIDPLSEEQVYLNGIFQRKDDGYIKTSCQSLLNSLFYPAVKPYNYYNGEEFSFNLL